MKNWIAIGLICILYFVIAIATKKSIDLPVCSNQIVTYLQKDTTVICYYQQMKNDTVVILCYKDTSILPQKAQDLCKIFKDSCGITNKKILFVGNTTNPSSPMTPYGKQLYITQCP